jgi:hypothetical protein
MTGRNHAKRTAALHGLCLESLSSAFGRIAPKSVVLTPKDLTRERTFVQPPVGPGMRVRDRSRNRHFPQAIRWQRDRFERA